MNRISVEIAYKRWQELDFYKPLTKLKKPTKLVVPMNNVQLSELIALPQASNETSITIPAENSSSTNNSIGKFKNYFISNFGELSWKFQVQVKTMKNISKFPSVIKFLCSYITCCCASCCQLLPCSWFLESLLDSFLELINSPEIICHKLFLL